MERAPTPVREPSPRVPPPVAVETPTPFPGVHVAVVIPCYRVERHIRGVVSSLPSWVRTIITVDDASPDGTGQVLASIEDPRLVVLRHERNGGVGAAMQTGFREAISRGADVIVKMDGDGQMDPEKLPAFVGPLAAGTADVTKGNRWADLHALKSMPPLRLAGNTALGFLVRVASGYWSVFDPVNGYLAVRTDVLRTLTRPLPNRYFFECGFLIELGIQRAVVLDVPMAAKYGDEESSLSITRTLFGFPPRLLKGFARRLLWRYFIYDFSAVSLLLLAGLPLFLFGVIYGLSVWSTGEFASAGQVMIAAMPVILGFQLLLQAIVLDIANVPRVPLCRALVRI